MSSAPHDRSSRQAKIQAAAPKQSNLKPVLAAIIAVIAIAGIGAAILVGMRQSGGGQSQAGGLPRGAQGQGQGILLNPTPPAAGVPTLDVYEDYQCPACRIYHEVLGTSVDELATSGKAKVVIHTKSFLDANLGTEHSRKAANFAACASDAGPQAYMKVHDGLFATQAAQEGAGWSDDTLKKIADDAGITGDARKTFDACVKNDTYAGYVSAVEETSARAKVTSTPTYRLNGKDYDLGQVTDPNTRGPRQDAGNIFRSAVESATK